MLQVPFSKLQGIKQKYNGVHQHACHWEYYLTQHPAPSWKQVASGLWWMGEHGALEVVQTLYLKGKPHSSADESSDSLCMLSFFCLLIYAVFHVFVCIFVC